MGSSPFARRYLGNRSFFLFLRVLRCFSSPRSLLLPYVFRQGYRAVTLGGLPHSEIPGLTLACSSPRLFAACRVLLRLPAPRHPPYALCSLTLSRAFSSIARLLGSPMQFSGCSSRSWSLVTRRSTLRKPLQLPSFQTTCRLLVLRFSSLSRSLSTKACFHTSD